MSEDIQGNTEKLQIVLPRIATTRARIRVVALEGAFNNVIFGVSETDFTIAGNIGSGAEISFISSERLDLSWSDVPSEEMPTGVSGSSRLAINLRLINRGATAILNPFLRVVDLSRGNVLLTRDSRSRPSDGARQSIDVGEDSLLGPGETGQVRLIIGLVNRKKFNLSVELYGVPAQGLIGPGDPVRVWSGKPRNK